MSQPDSRTIYNTQSLQLIAGQRVLLDELNINIYPGETWCVLGKNGSGKTTLLTTMAGLQPPASGQLFLGNRNLVHLHRKNIAQKMGMLFQEYPDSFPVTVFESVMAGRYPHMKSWQLESAVDREKTLSALAFVQMTSFTHRMVNTLSGGEKRRVALATLLAQDPAIYLLDEPANHLDLHFQASLLPDLCSALKQKNKTVFMSLHDINLATHLTDKCLLLMGNGEHLLGETREIMTRENLETLYNQPFEKIETETGTKWLPRF
ncbi:MAG: ABC transporter ATP-binding protein [Gammaproteobacteria bacterium]